MLPLRDENPTSSIAIVTLILIAINVVVFLMEPIVSSGRDPREQQARQVIYFACHAAMPYEVTHGERAGDALRRDVRFGTPADNAFAAIESRACPHKSVLLSVLSSMFLHASLLHLAGNMLFLWIFGNNVEDRLGKIRFVIFYLLCGLAAALAQSFVFPGSTVPLIGASGAIAGILGAYLIMFPRARIFGLLFIFPIVLPAFVFIGFWFISQLLSSVGSVTGNTSVAYAAHVGGFVAGMVLLLLLRPRRPEAIRTPYPY